jgi:hypothetical protein
MDYDNELEHLVDSLAQDLDVLAIWLGGSRAKGLSTSSSDFDVWVFLAEDAFATRQREGLPRKRFQGQLEIYFTHLEELERHRSMEPESLGIRYAVAGTQPLLDKTGQLRQLIAELGTFPVSQQRQLITRALDAYCNAFLRSVKAVRRADRLAALLQASRSIDHLLTAVFASHERFPPFVEYLRAEVPSLIKIPWRDALQGRLLAIAERADVATQQALERDIEAYFRNEGYGDVFDAWEQTAGPRWQESLRTA